MRLPTKSGIRFRWMWNHDVYEDMWNHGVLFGILFAMYLNSWTLDEDEQDGYDYYYVYIGFGLFYIRLVLKVWAFDWDALRFWKSRCYDEDIPF